MDDNAILLARGLALQDQIEDAVRNGATEEEVLLALEMIHFEAVDKFEITG